MREKRACLSYLEENPALLLHTPYSGQLGDGVFCIPFVRFGSLTVKEARAFAADQLSCVLARGTETYLSSGSVLWRCIAHVAYL